MWVVVYMAHHKKDVDAIEGILGDENIPYKIRPVYKNIAPEVNCFEIMVPQSEVGEVHNILMEYGF
ncbi:MAG: hypothetical protein GX340_02490 [Clostridiales bacterium]|jgi:hypothetical protein|nr:hypothetical protein [Clostridiales bacterium]